uniref:Uncharacterized protein n=1 Tax=Arundo donax TaxID=35708 RepID=A0A0A9C9L2_ARUDO
MMLCAIELLRSNRDMVRSGIIKYTIWHL